MKLHLIIACIATTVSFSANAQFKRSYNHYYNTLRVYQSFALEQTNQEIDLVRAEMNASNELLVTTSSIDKNGDVLTVTQFNYGTTGLTGVTPLITGVFDEGTDRIITFSLANSSTAMNYYVLKYNKATGAETGDYLNPATFKQAFVSTIRNGNQLVNYGVKSSNGLYRTTFDVQTLNSTTEELVDGALTAIGNISGTQNGKDGGKVILFNGKEVSTFVSGTKQLFERTAASTYAVHALNANTSGSCNLLVLPNGNLFVHNNSDLFELNSSFNIVNSTAIPDPSALNSVEFGLLDNHLHQFITYNPATKTYYRKFDLAFNMVDSIATPLQKNLDVFTFNGGLALLGSLSDENQVNSFYDGNDQITPQPVSIEFFKSTPLTSPTQEFHYQNKVNNITVDLGLGNQFFPHKNNNTSGIYYNDSIPVVYTMANFYEGLSVSSFDTLGMNSSMFEPQFLPGPYTTNGMYTDLVSDRYNRGFFVTREMIEDHLDSLANGTANYVAPHGIRNWPAHGDVSLGQAEILAAFVDINANNIYEPYQGDYPSIYGDYCFFSITHDNPNTSHSASIETHSYKYWFDCDTSESYENTIFNKSLYFSRVENFGIFRLGTYADQDLGYYNNDYIGTHVNLGLVYNYNGQLYDSNNSGIIGFKDKCPASGIMVLKGTKMEPDGLDNPIGVSQNGSVNGYGFSDSQIDNEYKGLEYSVYFSNFAPASQADPNVYNQYNNYLNGLWRFGDQVFFGGTGFPGNAGTTTIEAHYVFPGDSDPVNYGTEGVDPGFTWSEAEPTGTGSISNPPGDRRFIASTGFQKLLIGDTVIYDIAYVISNDTNVVTTLDQAPNSLFAKCEIIKNNFNLNAGGCGIDFDPIEEDLATIESKLDNVLVYPNPTNNLFKIDGLVNPTASIAIYDIEGRLLFEQSGINGETEISLDAFKGNVFMVSIVDGTNKYVKRIVKN